MHLATIIAALQQAPTTTIAPSPPDSGDTGVWTIVVGIVVAIVLVGVEVLRRSVRQRRTQPQQASAGGGDPGHRRVEQAGRDRLLGDPPQVEGEAGVHPPSDRREVEPGGAKAQPSISTLGGVFISYRRQDTAAYARLLREELSNRLDEQQVFMDVDSVEVGVDFAEAIERAIASCVILLAVIGPQWATISDADGRRRLDDPDDIVRREIEAGLARNIRVVPVLVDGTQMPGRQQLPESLGPLTRRNALELSYNRYAYDIEQLLQVIDKTLGRR
jgi:hypothetical protein